jgi:hypothetical protein
MTLVERKAGDAATCVRLLRSKGLLESVVVQAFDWKFVGACHREAPELVLAALGRDALDEKQLDEAAATGAKTTAADFALGFGPSTTWTRSSVMSPTALTASSPTCRWAFASYLPRAPRRPGAWSTSLDRPRDNSRHSR